MLCVVPQLRALDVDSIAQALVEMPDYAASVVYAVTLPQADHDVVYTIDLQQPGSEDHYLINWSVDTPSGLQTGFTAWFDGHFYNFRNRRLREVHGEESVGGEPWNSVQFASLLPSRMASELRSLTPGSYDVTVSRSGGRVRVDALRRSGNIVDAELCWIFDEDTLEPLEFRADYNPGTISGQQVTATYSPASNPLFTAGESLSEPALHDLFPEAFELYRESNFAVGQLRGEPLPGFSLPLACGEGRLTRSAGAEFDRPVAVVLFNPSAVLSPQLVDAVRKAVDRLPAPPAVIWACTCKNPSEVDAVTGRLRPGETALTGAAKLAAECGAVNLPVVLVCNAGGLVCDLVIGLNNSLDSDVIRMFSAIK